MTSMLIKFFKELNIFLSSIISSILFALFLVVFTSSVFKSTSLLSVNDLDQSPSVQNSIISSIVSDTPESLYQLKDYLESFEASKEFSNLIDIDKFYSNNSISYFSQFGSILSKRFHDYYLNHNDFLIQADSKSIRIETTGFKAEQALQANLALIFMVSDYYDRKTRLEAAISLAKKRCELKIVESDNINGVLLETGSEFELDKFDSAKSLIFDKTNNFYEQCLKLQTSGDSLSELPKQTLSDVNSFTTKQLIGEIFDSKMDSLSITNNVSIIYEPTLSEYKESKRISIKTLFFFISMYLILLSIKIAIKIRNEFIF